MKHHGLLSRIIAVAILCFSFALFQTSSVFAVEDSGDDAASPSADGDVSADDENADADLTSAFQNPAQAAHASQLADAAASLGNEETEEKLAAVDKANEELGKAMEAADPGAIEQAEIDVAAAEQAYADAVAELTGVISQDLLDMREAGMGWGNIAKELGVHPGVLGLGHTKGKQKSKAEAYEGATTVGSIEASEVVEATARNTRSGYAKGHGLAMNTGVDSDTSSLGFGAKSKSKGTGVAGASGLGSGQGTASNNGNRGGDNNSSDGPGNSSNSNKGGAGVAGIDGNPGGSNSSNASDKSNSKDKNDKTNNGKSDDRGNSQK